MYNDGRLGDLINDVLLKDINTNVRELEVKKLNKTDILSMANMGQDVKEAMTGGSVAIVGRNSILKENIVDGQVTTEKTDFINISSNLFNKNDVITNKYINNTDGTLLDSPVNTVSQFIDISPRSQLTFKKVQKIACYNESKEFLRIEEFSADTSNSYTLGTDVYFIRTQQPISVLDEVQINKGSELLTYESYYRNIKKEIGIENIEDKIKEKSITSDKRSVLGTMGRLYISPSSSDLPSIDTNARTLTLYNNFWVLVNKKRYSHNEQVVLTFLDTATIQYLFYNTTTNTFKFIKTTLENEILEDDVYIGMFSFSSNTESNVTIKHTYCDFPLKIDGEIIGDYSTKISNLEERLKAIENNGGTSITIPKNIPIYVPKTTYACDGSDSNGFTHDVTKANDVYVKYDELVAKYPNYITKTLLGNDSSGTLPIYKYEFKPTQPTILDGYDNTFKKIILINGVHGGGRTTADSGDNPTSVFALYYLMKDICENSGQEGLEYLRRNVHFVIIPIANPWGFNNLSRYNVNGVDINRNFDYKWARVEYSGTSAFSEKETQYIRDVVNENKDALFASDLHIQGGGTDPNVDTRLLWSSLNTGSKLYYPSNYLISRMSGLWQGKYNLSDNEYYGYLTANNNGMMVRSWVEYVTGIPCNTFEMSSAAMNQTRNNANIMFMMTQTIGNWILSCINIL